MAKPKTPSRGKDRWRKKVLDYIEEENPSQKDLERMLKYIENYRRIRKEEAKRKRQRAKNPRVWPVKPGR